VEKLDTKDLRRPTIQDYILGRAVRSATRNLICERRTKTATGARAFGVFAPKVWHDLPDLSIQSGIYLLTRHLFTATESMLWTCFIVTARPLRFFVLKPM